MNTEENETNEDERPEASEIGKAIAHNWSKFDEITAEQLQQMKDQLGLTAGGGKRYDDSVLREAIRSAELEAMVGADKSVLAMEEQARLLNEGLYERDAAVGKAFIGAIAAEAEAIRHRAEFIGQIGDSSVDLNTIGSYRPNDEFAIDEERIRRAAEESERLAYLNPGLVYPPPIYEPPREYSPGPAPSGGKEVDAFNVIQQVNCEGIRSVLNDEFGLEKSRAGECYLVKHEGSDHWHIYIFPGSQDELDHLLPLVLNRDEKGAFRAWSEWSDKIQVVGYVALSCRPIAPVRFLALSDEYSEHIFFLGGKVRKELVRWGLAIQNEKSASNEDVLNQLEKGIVDVVKALSEERAKITNGIISGELEKQGIYNKKAGELYSDEHISRTRSKLRKLGYSVG